MERKQQQLRDEFNTDNVKIAQPTEIDNEKINDTKDQATLDPDNGKPGDSKSDGTVTVTKDQETPNPDSKKPGDSKTEDPDFPQAES